MQGPKFLTAEQVLLTTLVVKLAVMAALATMLVRYRRFRHILIFERRAWPDRLVFVASFGIPLAAGVAARLLLGYNAADLTLEGSFVAGLIAGPYAGAIVGAMVGLPPLGNGEIIALPFAIGCGFAGRRPARAVPEGSHLALLAVRLHRASTAARGRCSGPSRWTGRSCCCSRRSRSSCCARGSARAGSRRTACSTCRRRPTRRG